jgi:hypothetical protein
MLGSKYANHIKTVFQQKIDQVFVTNQAGMIGKHSNALIFQERKIFRRTLGSHDNFLGVGGATQKKNHYDNYFKIAHSLVFYCTSKFSVNKAVFIGQSGKAERAG